VRRLLLGLIFAGLGRRAYRLLASGALTIDVGVGRRTRPLGPMSWEIAASRDTVFEVISSPYLGPTPRALKDKLQVWERSAEMVLAAHYTHVKCGVTTTVETVRFSQPERIDFRVVRGPVPHLVEAFILEPTDVGTRLTWEGELGTDFWAVGAWWGDRVASAWEKAVHDSLKPIAAEAERRTSPHAEHAQ
jgi:hypothetical protein